VTFEQMAKFLDLDPENLNLLADAANSAAEEGRWREVENLVARYGAIDEPPTDLINLRGLAALALEDFATAKADFATVLAAAPGETGVIYNLAYAYAQSGQHLTALDLLDDDVVRTIPTGAALKVQLLHQLGDPQEALNWGAGFADNIADHPGLASALAIAALESEDFGRAGRFAGQAGATPEGLSTLGMLALDQARPDEALVLFEDAVARGPDNARARLGRGLVLMAQDRPQEAVVDLDRAAGIFQTHLGTWIAAGWAHFVNGDLATSRQRFETALAIDDTFAECHGGLAVLDAMAGEVESATRGADIALRLDRMSLGGHLAKILLAAAKGDSAKAERLRTLALNMAITPDGRTINQISASLARGQR